MYNNIAEKQFKIKNKVIKKIAKIFLYTLAVFIILVMGAYAALRSPASQTWITQRVASYLSAKLKTRVEVKGVDIEFFKKVVLEGIYIEDLHQDTLLYAKAIKIDITRYNLEKHKILISSIHLDSLTFKLKKYKTDSVMNLAFIFNAFASSDTNVTSSKPWKLYCGKIVLNNATFAMRDEDEPKSDIGVDYFNIYARHINGTIDDVYNTSDALMANIHKLSFIDKSGFVMKELSMDTKLSAKEVACNHLILKTPFTNLYTNLSFLFKEYPDWLDFNNKVTMRSKLMASEVSMRDIAFFAPYLTGMTNLVKISGNVDGTVNKLKGKNLSIYLGSKTILRGNIVMNGLPNIDSTYFNFNINELKTNKKDIEQIPVPPFHDRQLIKLPDNIALLGDIDFSGKFTGLFSNFSASGHAKTDIGEAAGDIKMRYTNTSPVVYTSHISTTDFYLGRFIGQENILGRVTLSADIKGSDFDPDKMVASLTGNIANIDFKNYSYKNITLNGTADKNIYDAKVIIKENNIDLDLDGKINLKNKLPQYDIAAQLKNVHFKKLNLINRDSTSSLSTTIKASFSGNEPDNFLGKVTLENTTYKEKKTSLSLDNLSLTSASDNTGKTLTLNSDDVDASINGHFSLVKLPDSFKNFISYYVDGLKLEHKIITRDQSFNFSVNLKKTDTLTHLFVPALKIAPNTILKGNYNDAKDDISLDVNSTFVKYDNYTFSTVHITDITEDNVMKLTATVQQVFLKDSVLIDLAKLTATSIDQNITFRLELANLPENRNKADILGEAFFRGNQGFEFKFRPSTIMIESQLWKIDNKNSIKIDSVNALSVSSLRLTNNTQIIDIDGNLANKKGEGADNLADNPLQVSLTNLDLNNFSRLVKTAGIDLAGIANGKVFVYSNANGKIGLSSNLKISYLKFNGDSLGTATINSTWDDETGIVGIIANIVKGTAKIVDVKGQYAIYDEKNSLNFDVVIDKVYLQLLDKYLKEYISDLKGIISAEVHVAGTFQDPAITGKAKVQKTSFVFNYLNTRYNLSDEFTITDHDISIDRVVINDVRGNTIVANGKILHNHFKNFRFDIDLNASNFQALNTRANQNSMYYGHVYVSGTATIAGTVDNLIMNMAMKSEKGTEIFIPLSNSEEVSQSDFITFVNKKAKTTDKKKPQVYVANLSGISMNFDLEITPDAEVQLIFDSKIGDVIKGSGSGNIKMEINTLGNFSMYGDYTIYRGSYLFTLQNVVNKPLNIERGGTIRWNGNPLDAEININAIYSVNASLYDIIKDDERYRRPIPVECKINMSNKLLNPSIKYDINIPNIDETTNALVRSTITRDGGDKGMSNQVISLLLFNRFAPTGNTANNNNTVSSGLATNGSELLSSQLSNWASQIGKSFGKDINIGVNYRPKDELNQKQLEVIYSTQLFNDRIIVNGNVGQAYNYNSTQNSTNIVGDFSVEYKVFNDGRFRLKAFNLSNNNTLIRTSTAEYKQGIGVFYREEFDSFDELLKRYKRKQK